MENMGGMYKAGYRNSAEPLLYSDRKEQEANKSNEAKNKDQNRLVKQSSIRPSIKTKNTSDTKDQHSNPILNTTSPVFINEDEDVEVHALDEQNDKDFARLESACRKAVESSYFGIARHEAYSPAIVSDCFRIAEGGHPAAQFKASQICRRACKFKSIGKLVDDYLQEKFPEDNKIQKKMRKENYWLKQAAENGHHADALRRLEEKRCKNPIKKLFSKPYEKPLENSEIRALNFQIELDMPGKVPLDSDLERIK